MSQVGRRHLNLGIKVEIICLSAGKGEVLGLSNLPTHLGLQSLPFQEDLVGPSWTTGADGVLRCLTGTQ